MKSRNLDNDTRKSRPSPHLPYCCFQLRGKTSRSGGRHSGETKNQTQNRQDYTGRTSTACPNALPYSAHRKPSHQKVEQTTNRIHHAPVQRNKTSSRCPGLFIKFGFARTCAHQQEERNKPVSNAGHSASREPSRAPQQQRRSSTTNVRVNFFRRPPPQVTLSTSLFVGREEATLSRVLVAAIALHRSSEVRPHLVKTSHTMISPRPAANSS